MAKVSADYEVVYIIDPSQSEEAIAATVAKFQALADSDRKYKSVPGSRPLWGREPQKN